jgi:hypothetical protein
MSNVTISTMAAATTPLAGTELMEMSQLGTVHITASTLSAVASDNSYNDSANGFVSAGFAVGDRVNVVGFTGNTANNILTGTVTVLTTGKMTIGGTDGDVIVDDAAGESVTITKWTTKRASVKDVGAGSNTSFVAFGTLTISSNTIGMDLGVNSTFKVSLTANVTTVNMTNITNSKANFFTLLVSQDATGSRTWANPSSWKFPSGVAYSPTTAANSVDLLQGVSYDNGITWYVTYAKDLK